MAAKKKAARGSRDYWNRRVLADKAGVINNAEDFLLKNQRELYGKAEKEIQKEVEQLYQKFADQQKVSLAEAKRLIRDADFRKIDWDGMVKQSMELREQIRNGKGSLPDEVVRNLEEQHKKLEDQLKAFAKRGRISYLELKEVEIDRKLLRLYDDQQKNIYDYLRSEYDDGYYRQVFNSQQMQGYGYDFIHPNEAAIDRAILNRYQRQNYSKTLYSHCDHFSKDLRENLVTGMIRGESLDTMAGRIKKRMGVAYSAAKTLVRTETAYVYEQATKEAYEQCDIEWYEYLATLDNKTSEVCRNLDGKHFRVKDAMPGRNYPPMHPNCRSTTVCWFPDEEGKKKQTTRLAKDGDGKYYEVPADMTYKQWQEKYGQGKSEKAFMMGNKTAAVVLNDVQFADTHEELAQYMSEKLGISYAGDMYDLDLPAVRQTVQGMEVIFDKFEGTGNLVKNVRAASIGDAYMSCAVDTIKYNPDSFKKADKRLNYEMVGCHEAAHLLEWKLIDIMGYKDKEAAWNQGMAANAIVKEAARKLKAEYPNTSVKELKRQISINAELSPSECLADSMVDFLYNAEKAAPLSKEIYKIVRRMIR